MNNRQKRMGYNAAVEFTEQLSKFFQQKRRGTEILNWHPKLLPAVASRGRKQFFFRGSVV